MPAPRGALAPRLGYAATTADSLLAAVTFRWPRCSCPRWGDPARRRRAGLLLYASQPLLIVAAQNAVPRASAAAGLVIGVGNGVAGLLYISSGALQGVLGLAPVMFVSFALLVPTALLAGHALRIPRPTR